jgi:hypothetical protein
MMRLKYAGALAVMLLSGCVVAPGGPPPVPVARVEVVPPPPSARVVWQPGGWHWNGGAYVWIRGHYVERQAAYHRWVPGHWQGGAWIPAHWV